MQSTTSLDTPAWAGPDDSYEDARLLAKCMNRKSIKREDDSDYDPENFSEGEKPPTPSMYTLSVIHIHCMF